MRAIYRLAHTVVGAFIRMRYRVDVRGLDNLPADRGVILACNHQSNFDPVLVATSLSREIHFLAKKELFSFRPFGWWLELLNTIPIERRRVDMAAMKRVRKTLAGGHDLIFFPEGTRSRNGALGPFRKGIAMVSLLSGSPVLPVLIHGTRQRGGFLLGRPPVLLRFGQVIETAELKALLPATGDRTAGYVRIAERIREPIAAMALEAGMPVGSGTPDEEPRTSPA